MRLRVGGRRGGGSLRGGGALRIGPNPSTRPTTMYILRFGAFLLTSDSGMPRGRAGF